MNRITLDFCEGCNEVGPIAGSKQGISCWHDNFYSKTRNPKLISIYEKLYEEHNTPIPDWCPVLEKQKKVKKCPAK